MSRYTPSRYTPTLVHDPIHNTFDIRSILPLVETPEFQALAEKRQLGMSYLVFRNARHTRFEHSLGAYRGTRIVTNRFIADGRISKEEQTALCVYAAIHDVGHPAFSHVTEDFCERDDDEQTLRLVETRLRNAVIQCGVDPNFLADLITHHNPLYRIVHDKNLGMEKLDYLERDGMSVGFGRPPGIGAVRNQVFYVDGHMAIDEKVVDHAVDILSFYMKMYKEVYFRKALVIAQRMFQKAVYELIKDESLSPDELYDMTDPELVGSLSRTRNPITAKLYEQIRERRLFKEAVVIRSEEFAAETRVMGKAIAVRGISPLQMQQLVGSPDLQKRNHAKLEEIERILESVVGLPEGTILIVPVFNPERFKVQDVMIYGADEKLYSLQERRPAHFKGMEETARAYSALRICSQPEHREALSKAAGDVLACVLDWIT